MVRPLRYWIAASDVHARGVHYGPRDAGPRLDGPVRIRDGRVDWAVPDMVMRDGVSQSTIVVTAKDPQGAPIRSLQMRLDMLVNGVVQDFGSLSTRTLFTNSDGRATAIYTAPPAPGEAPRLSPTGSFDGRHTGRHQRTGSTNERRHPPRIADHHHAGTRRSRSSPMRPSDAQRRRPNVVVQRERVVSCTGGRS